MNSKKAWMATMAMGCCLIGMAQINIGFDRQESLTAMQGSTVGPKTDEAAGSPIGDALLSSQKESTSETALPAVDSDEANMCYVQMGKKIYHVSNTTDTFHIYKTEGVNPQNCFIVISKKEFRLYVYEKVGADTLLVAHYPVCYAKYPENKRKVGDMRTPESSMKSPFTISQIQDASSWKHDFRDGRGSVKAYGNWFLRLYTPGHSGIGIHGSTNNESSIPGRDSEGCIRLRDADIIHLKTHYARLKTRVVIKPLGQGKLPFELRAEKQLGKDYVAPRKGYTPLTGAKIVQR